MKCSLCSYDNPPGLDKCDKCGKFFFIKAGKRSKKILIIEDNSYIRLWLRTYLKVEGFVTIEADDGIKGVNKALEEIPDLILMDLLLPNMDGIEAISTIRKNQKISHIPILVVSCLSTKTEILKALEAGCNDYLKKPVYPHILKEKINQLIKRNGEKSISMVELQEESKN